MTPDDYLGSLRDVLDDYELDVTAARLRLQERLRMLLGPSGTSSIDPPVRDERAVTVPPAMTPAPAQPQQSEPASPAGLPSTPAAATAVPVGTDAPEIPTRRRAGAATHSVAAAGSHGATLAAEARSAATVNSNAKVACPHCRAPFYPRGLGPHIAKKHAASPQVLPAPVTIRIDEASAAADQLDVGVCPRCDQRLFHLSAHIPTCSGRPGVGEPPRNLSRCDEDGCQWRGPTLRSLDEHRRREHRPGNPRSKPPLELPARRDQAVGE